jgi:hypothetical protein
MILLFLEAPSRRLVRHIQRSELVPTGPTISACYDRFAHGLFYNRSALFLLARYRRHGLLATGTGVNLYALGIASQ